MCVTNIHAGLYLTPNFSSLMFHVNGKNTSPWLQNAKHCGSWHVFKLPNTVGMEHWVCLWLAGEYVYSLGIQYDWDIAAHQAWSC